GPVGAGEPGGRGEDGGALAARALAEFVRVAVGEQPGGGAASRHSIAAGVVDDDEVDAARLLAPGRQPGPRASADDGNAALDHGVELLQDRFSRYVGHGSLLVVPDRVAISRKLSTRASANSGSLMCRGRRTIRRWA